MGDCIGEWGQVVVGVNIPIKEFSSEITIGDLYEPKDYFIMWK